MSQRRLPHHCLIVRTYDEFRGLVEAFASGAYELLVIVGGPGLGKSEIVKRIMQGTLGALGWGLIKGKHSPLDLYERTWRFRTVPLAFDDLDDLLQKKENVMLLKCLCETQPVKRIAWSSRYAAFANGELPKSFESISRVCLIANDWNALDRNIAAVFDRGLVVLFQPTALEVHREIARGGWFDDDEVFRFVGQNLFLVTESSFRFYKIARDHKRAGLDWQALTLRTMEIEADPKQILVARLLADPQYESDAARFEAFRKHGDGGSAPRTTGIRPTFLPAAAILTQPKSLPSSCNLVNPTSTISPNGTVAGRLKKHVTSREKSPWRKTTLRSALGRLLIPIRWSSSNVKSIKQLPERILNGRPNFGTKFGDFNKKGTKKVSRQSSFGL